MDGLYELVPHNAGDSGKELNFVELSGSEKNAVGLQNLKQQLAISCAQAREEVSNIGDLDFCPPSSKVPVYREPESIKRVQNELRNHSKLETLSDLCQQNSGCQRCSLVPTRNQFVFGSGNEGSLLLFVGEGPGADEDRLGLPFVGKAGKLLDRMIDVIGLDREDVYVTNVVKCRPPNNRNPASDEIAHCMGILERQIELVNPKLIVTLGNVPTQALLPGSPGITKSRGSLKKYRNWNILPTFHPSYLLRNPNAMHEAWEDFQKISEYAFPH
ncbi:MAG: uracil-DNA glycosylase [Deltaproteobacteria bacterium]|nr:uracil-DNA glycosylase [Deltaproteobacteria bacterium]